MPQQPGEKIVSVKNDNKKSARKKVGVWQRLQIRLSDTEIMMLARHLTVLLDSGLALIEALDTLTTQAKGPLKSVLTRLSQSVRTGQTLADGLEHYNYIFSPVFINLVRAGEASGTLSKNLEQLASKLEKDHALKQKIRGAMMYPSVVMLSAIVIGSGVVVFVLPNITNLFRAFDVDLPWTTRALLWIAELIDQKGEWLLLGIVLFCVLILIIRSINAFKPATHWLLLHTPVLGKIAKLTNLARITRLMGTLLKTGATLTESLSTTLPILRNVCYQRLFKESLEHVSHGESLTSSLEKFPNLMPPIGIRLIHVGEESGTLGDMFEYLAKFYEQEVDDLLKNMTTLLEPILIVFIGAMVAILALAVISPIYSIIGTV